MRESQYAAEAPLPDTLWQNTLSKSTVKQCVPNAQYPTITPMTLWKQWKIWFIIERIEEAKRECQSPLFFSVERVDISGVSFPDCFGTADMVIVTDKVAHIIDLKLGRGVEVSAEENPQLMAYGLGVLEMAEMLMTLKRFHYL